MLKRSVISFLMFLMLAVMMPLATATTADAQTRRYRTRTARYYYYKKPNVYRRHRKAFNIGGGALGGAIIGNFALQLWAVRRLGMQVHISFDWKNPDVMKVWKLIGPRLVSASKSGTLSPMRM